VEEAAGPAEGQEELPEEDREALQHFLQQKRNVINRLDSDEEAEQDDLGQTEGAAAGLGPSSAKAGEQEESLQRHTGAGGGRAGVVFRQVVKVKVKAKRPNTDNGQQLKRSRVEEQQDRPEQGLRPAVKDNSQEQSQSPGDADGGGMLPGLLGYGSNSSSGEDGQ
jgi:hypothetical protein